MEQEIRQFLETLVRDDLVTYKIGCNAADQIYCVDFFANPNWRICTWEEPHRPLTSILVSSWDKHEEWTDILMDAYMKSLALATSDPRILIDRYTDNYDDDDEF